MKTIEEIEQLDPADAEAELEQLYAELADAAWQAIETEDEPLACGVVTLITVANVALERWLAAELGPGFARMAMRFRERGFARLRRLWDRIRGEETRQIPLLALSRETVATLRADGWLCSEILAGERSSRPPGAQLAHDYIPIAQLAPESSFPPPDNSDTNESSGSGAGLGLAALAFAARYLL